MNYRIKNIKAILLKTFYTTLKIYDGLYHEILNEPEKVLVIGVIVYWLDSHI